MGDLDLNDGLTHPGAVEKDHATGRHRPRRTPRSATPLPAPALVLGSVLSVQFGQAFSKLLFEVSGPAGVSTLRFGFAALVLVAIWRPRVPRDPRGIALVIAFGTAIAGMTMVYPALRLLPLGIATTLQLLGPLAVALLSSRRLLDLGWALAALGGVALLANPSEGSELPIVGVLLALVAAVSMAAYVLLSHRAGARSADGSILALAVVWAALITLPFGIAESGAALLRPVAVLGGLVVAALSAVVPYSLDLAALRKLPPRVVGVLQSLEPAVAGLAGVVVLSEFLTSIQVLGIGCVTIASVGAVLTRRPSPPTVPDSPTTAGDPAGGEIIESTVSHQTSDALRANPDRLDPNT